MIVVLLPSGASGLTVAGPAVRLDGTCGNAFATSQGLAISRL